MIQRKQSVYLLLTILFSVLFLQGNMIRFNNGSENFISMTVRGILRLRPDAAAEYLGSMLPLTIPLLLIASLSLVVIFLYRNRRLQMMLTLVLIGVSVISILIAGAYIFFIAGKYTADIIFNIKILIPVLIVVCLILAYRGIRKDEDMVRSYDRLR